MVFACVSSSFSVDFSRSSKVEHSVSSSNTKNLQIEV